MYRLFFKRILDFSAALIGLLVLSPVLVVLLIILYFANEGKPFFYQIRPGKHEKLFKIVKFKTMNDKTDSEGRLLPDNARITGIGRFVRRTSLDEIPQLFNVLKGDMSLIGPRPLLVDYLNYYNEKQKKRHLIRPGITGWAQVNGRNAISWEEKFELDVWYVHNISFVTDMKILFQTVKKVFHQEGISNSKYDTMPRFMGSSNETKS